MTDALPFFLGLLLILFQPILDRVWLGNYKRVYDPEEKEGLVTPAEWVADTAQFLPSGALTIVGIAVLESKEVNKIGVIAIVATGLFLALIAYIAAGTRSNPGDRPRFRYSWLQILLITLNGAGLALAIIKAVKDG